MKFSYWLSRILGTTTLLIISIIGLGVVGGIATGGYFLKDPALTGNLITYIQNIIDGFGNTNITSDIQGIINNLEVVKGFLISNKDLFISLGDGLFIGSIVFGSIFIGSIILWLCLAPAYKRKTQKAISHI